MGNVLMDFNPKYILSCYFNDIEKINQYYEYYFKSGLWSQLDNGDLSFEELIQNVAIDNPEDKATLIEFINTWHLHKWERKEMTALVKQLSDKGYGIHLCSNAANKFYSYIDQYPVFEHFDSITISADHKTSKPEKEIYEIVLEENKLKAHECLFVDDLGPNILAAENLGIDGYHYNGNEKMFKIFLKNIGVL